MNMPKTIWENVLMKQETCGRMRKIRLNRRIEGKANRDCASTEELGMSPSFEVTLAASQIHVRVRFECMSVLPHTLASM